MDKIGDKIKNIRINLSISQSDMANILGTNQKTLSLYENNLTFPPIDILEKLAEKYNFNLHWLITGKGEMFVNALTGGRSQSSKAQAPEHLVNESDVITAQYLSMDNIADRFIEMRNKLGFNKSQLAQYIQSTPSIIGEIESGKREPSKNILMKLLSMYNVNINWLLSDKGDMFIMAGDELFHKRLKDFREKQGYSQKQLADILNIPQKSLSNYETGRTEPSLNI